MAIGIACCASVACDLQNSKLGRYSFDIGHSKFGMSHGYEAFVRSEAFSVRESHLGCGAYWSNQPRLSVASEGPHLRTHTTLVFRHDAFKLRNDVFVANQLKSQEAISRPSFRLR